MKCAYSNYLQTGRWVEVIDNINGPIIFEHAHKDLEEVEDQDKNGLIGDDLDVAEKLEDLDVVNLDEDLVEGLDEDKDVDEDIDEDEGLDC